MNVKHKIIEYLEYKGITPTGLEKMMGWTMNAFTKPKGVTSSRLQEILLAFDDLSLDWLFRDEGPMIREKGTNKIEEESNVERVDIRDSRKFDAQLNFSRSKIKNMDANYLQILANTAESFSRTNDELKLKIEELTMENALLKKKIAER